MQTYLPFPNIGAEIFSISLFGMNFALRWYALAYIFGLLFGMWLIKRLMRRDALWPGGKSPMAPAEVEDLLTYMIISVILGGRLGYVLFYQPAYFAQNPSEILAVWQGGMSFHGGFVGVIAGTVLFAWMRGKSVWSLGDAVAIAAPVGILLGRLANFVNGELWGKPTLQPWGMVFPAPAAQICPDGWQGPCGRHPSQLYEAGLEGALLFVVMLLLVRRGILKRPGALIGVFMIGYGISRMIVELFREPDAQFVALDNPLGHVLRFGELGLSQGQILSLPMVLIGSALVMLAHKRA